MNQISSLKLLGAAAGALLMTLASAGAAEYTARIGHAEAPGEPRHKTLVWVAEQVKEKTDGAVELQIFPSSQLGNNRQMIEAVQFGSIEAAVAPTSFVTGFNPAAAVLDIPYIVPEDPDQTAAILSGPFGAAVLGSFDDRGMKGVVLWLNGFKHFTSNEPIAEIPDFENQRFRVMDSKILIEQFAAIGASAIPLPFGELYTALQNGVVDGEENTLTAIQQMKFYEVQDYMSYSYHGVLVDAVIFNPTWWDDLPEEYRTVLDETFREAAAIRMELDAEHDLAAREEIKASGINVSEMTQEQRAELREMTYGPARDAYLEMTGDEGQTLLDLYESEHDRIVQ